MPIENKYYHQLCFPALKNISNIYWESLIYSYLAYEVAVEESNCISPNRTFSILGSHVRLPLFFCLPKNFSIKRKTDFSVTKCFGTKSLCHQKSSSPNVIVTRCPCHQKFVTKCLVTRCLSPYVLEPCIPLHVFP